MEPKIRTNPHQHDETADKGLQEGHRTRDMIGVTRMTVSGGFLHIDRMVREQFLDGEPYESVVVPAGDHLLIDIENEPVNLALRVALSEWKIGQPRNRKIHQYMIHVNRWHDLLAIEPEDGHNYVDVEIGVAEVGDGVSYAFNNNDSELISHMEAHQIAEDFIEKHVSNESSTLSTFTVPQAMKHQDVPGRPGNKQRLYDAFKERCEPYETDSRGTLRFNMPEEL